MRARILMALATVAVIAALALAARPHDATAAERVDRITAELRCPVCQGLSVKDSPSETARQMRELVIRRVSEGKTDAEIEREFTAAYGDWVLLAPPLVSLAGLVWLVPIVALVVGLAVTVRRLGPPNAEAAAPSPAQVAALRERVRAEEAADA
jgi:cytochrome c-type biogenesis protein CcmH